MKALYIQDLRQSLPWSQDSATDEEILSVKESLHDLNALESAIRAIPGALYLRFDANQVTVQNDAFYPIFCIVFAGMDSEMAGNIVKLRKH